MFYPVHMLMPLLSTYISFSLLILLSDRHALPLPLNMLNGTICIMWVCGLAAAFFYFGQIVLILLLIVNYINNCMCIYIYRYMSTYS